MYKTDTTTLGHGTTLVRHYDDGYGLDLQCGQVAEWQAYENQLADSPVGAYFGSKFFPKLVIDAWSDTLRVEGDPNYPAGFGGADTGGQNIYPDLNAWGSRIRIVHFPVGTGDGMSTPYRLPAALSHEVGHAFHNFCGAFNPATSYGDELRVVWELAFTTDHVPFGPSSYPWYDPAHHARTENAFEQWANTFRYCYGTNVSPGDTRGSTGPWGYGGPDPVLPGFESPAYHPEWAKMMRLLPETTAFLDACGYTRGSMQWRGDGTNGYWLFRRGDGTWVAQTDFYAWFWWNGSAWTAYAPTYTRV